MGPVESVNIASSAREQMRRFFEPQLESLQLGEEQIQQQSLAELEASLDRINDCIKHPESFGILKLQVTAKTGLIVTQSGSEAHFEVGIVPLLLERKRLILERIRSIKGEEQIDQLRELVKENVDPAVQIQFEEQVTALKAEIAVWQAKADEAWQA